MELTSMVLRGRTGSDVTLFQEENSRPYARFRLAVPRARRTDTGSWEELEGSWYTVKAWGPLALNIALALRKGQPVVVVGRPATQAWISKTGEATSELVVHANTVGHDLTLGVTTFSKVTRMPISTEQITDQPSSVAPEKAQPAQPQMSVHQVQDVTETVTAEEFEMVEETGHPF